MQALNFGWCWVLSLSSVKVHKHSHYFKHVSNYVPLLRLKWFWEQDQVQDFILVSYLRGNYCPVWGTYHEVDTRRSDLGLQKNPSVTWADKFIFFLQCPCAISRKSQCLHLIHLPPASLPLPRAPVSFKPTLPSICSIPRELQGF